MTLSEDIIGWIPGFYALAVTACLCAPSQRGSNVVNTRSTLGL